MIALDDSYRLTPEARRSAMVAAIEEGFFDLGLDSCEIACTLKIHERCVVRVLHALRNERRLANAASAKTGALL
jgi:hypothetical protein